MELEIVWVDEPAGELIRPVRADEPLPAVLVIHELWGLDPHIRDVSLRLAAAGFLVFAPDLYWSGDGRPPALAPARTRACEEFLDTLPVPAWGDEEAREAALGGRPDAPALRETFAALFAGDRAAFLRRLEDGVASLRALAPRVASIGWCMGGGLSARLTTTDTPPDAAVVFYGAPPEPDRHELVSAPILGFFGGDDHRLTQSVAPFAQSMARLGKPFEHHVYAGAPHAFFNDTRASYRARPSRHAWARALTFLDEHLS